MDPRIIFGNTCNRLMIESLVAAHSGGLARVSSRKLWRARPGDVVVTLGATSPKFSAHVARVLGQREDAVELVEVGQPVPALLADAVRADAGASARLSEIAQRGPIALCPYALDETTWALARELGLGVEGYASTPDARVIEMIHALNLKSGFRKRARALGLPVVPGAECRDHAEQRAACEALLDEHEAVLIKLDRSSNGYGHLRVTRGDRDAGRLSARLQQHARAFDAQPAATVVEAWLSLRSAPSLELRVDDEGPTVLYECDQLSRGIGSAAMVTPSRTLSPTARAAMLDWGRRFGEYLAGQGYRGVFDLDLAWTTDDALFVSEVNVRRTAGTHLYELVERLVGPGGAKAWVGDCRPSDTPSSFEEGQRRLKREGLAFDPDAGHGVVLTADSIDRGGLWRYVVIGESADHVDELERRLATILQFRQERAA